MKHTYAEDFYRSKRYARFMLNKDKGNASLSI